MIFVPLHEVYGDQALQETRSATIFDHDKIPDGDYGFVEFYCNKPDCDCRRAMIRVISTADGDGKWATLSYGWEDLEFYKRWMGSDNEMVREMVGTQ